MHISRAALAVAVSLAISLTLHGPAVANEGVATPPAELQQKADKGDPAAMRELGRFYEKAPQPANAAEAHKWYLKAAVAGDAEAQYYAGHDFLYRLERDNDEAIKWLEKAAAQGSAGAERLLGEAYLTGLAEVDKRRRFPYDLAKGKALLQRAAEKGDKQAQYILGYALYYGQFEKIQDETAAHKWLQLASAQGHPGAARILGEQYWFGSGVERDFAKSLVFYQRAAEAGDVLAQYQLGFAYVNGDPDGAGKDPAKAAKWFLAAARDGDVAKQESERFVERPETQSLFMEAIANSAWQLGRLYETGSGVEKDPARAALWYEQAALSQSREGAYYLAGAYERGEGVEKSPARAYFWYELARGNSHSFGTMEDLTGKIADAIARLEKQNTPAELADARERAALESHRRAQVAATEMLNKSDF
ncbi:MAG TPA: hypothetical protein VEF76_04085 [Patescibacteria group bacterium]|nr:hypothetical protein [Patescibacteria group bacterium]